MRAEDLVYEMYRGKHELDSRYFADGNFYLRRRVLVMNLAWSLQGGVTAMASQLRQNQSIHPE